MSAKGLRIVFMGTPGFAVPSLRILAENGYDIAAVVTAPDKPAGRGQQLRESEIKQAAKTLDLQILQPEKLRDPSFLTKLREIKPDVQVVVAFRMLPEPVWSLPPKGTFNLHASLLPQYRGAAPINWAVINGDQFTGVTTFMLQQEIDTGNIIFQEKTIISETDTAGILHDRLMETGASLVLKTLQAIEKGELHLISQDTLANHSQPLLPAPKIFREHCRLDWNSEGTKIHNLVRGLSPYPGAWFECRDTTGQTQLVKLFEAGFSPARHQLPNGKLLTDGKTFLKAAVKGGFLEINTLQLEGKKKLPVAAFLRGIPSVGLWETKG